MEAAQILSLGILGIRSDLQELVKRWHGDQKEFKDAVNLLATEWADVPPEVQLKVRAVLRRHDEYIRQSRKLPPRAFTKVMVHLAWTSYRFVPLKRIVAAEDKEARKAWDLAVKLDPSLVNTAHVNATNIDESRFISADPIRVPPRRRLV